MADGELYARTLGLLTVVYVVVRVLALALVDGVGGDAAAVGEEEKLVVPESEKVTAVPESETVTEPVPETRTDHEEVHALATMSSLPASARGPPPPPPPPLISPPPLLLPLQHAAALDSPLPPLISPPPSISQETDHVDLVTRQAAVAQQARRGSPERADAPPVASPPSPLVPRPFGAPVKRKPSDVSPVKQKSDDKDADALPVKREPDDASLVKRKSTSVSPVRRKPAPHINDEEMEGAIVEPDVRERASSLASVTSAPGISVPATSVLLGDNGTLDQDTASFTTTIDFSERMLRRLTHDTPEDFWRMVREATAAATTTTPLIHLRLDHNLLTSIDGDHHALFAQLSTATTHLDLSHNHLQLLPAELGMLRALRHLDLRMNKLTRLPEELGYLAALEHLDVANNELCELPTSIGRCKRLSLLDLSANRLRQLPSSLGQLNTTLRTLWTADNPWESPLKEILPSAYLVPVAKRNSRADLPSKLVKKGRRVSASAASVLLMDGDEPVRSAECAVDEEGARDRTRSECALDDEEARDRVRSRPYGSSHISSDSAFGGEETEDVPSSTLSTSPQRFSKLPFFRSQSIPNQSSSSSISTSPIAAFHSDAGPPGDPRPASLPATSTSQSPMANSPPIPPPRAIKMNACGLDFVLAYLRDLHDLDPSTREYPTAACEAIVVPELASLSTSPTASNGEITSGADANAATTVAACPLPPVPVVNRRKMLDRRRKIIEEIVKTEASYVQYLATVSELYLEPLKNEPQVISREEHRVLFSNLNTIHLMHVTLLDELRCAAAASTSAEDDDDGIDACNDTIGATFVRHSAYLKMYSVYVNNFDSAMVELARLLAKRKKFRGFCQSAQSHPAHTQTNLQFYLIMPVQRVPRYKLLLEDLLKHTDPSHPDHPALSTAFDEVRKRASEINERKREQEASDKVVAIQNKIKGTFKTALVQPHRRLLRETMLTLERCVKRVVVKSGSGVKAQLKEAMVERDYLFLIFNDIILQCKVVAPASNGGSSSSLVTATSTISSTPPATSLTSPTAQTIPTDAAYELVRTLRLSSRHRPASIVHQTWAGSLAPSLPIAKPRMLLRVVDEDVVVYVRGGVEELDMVCRMVNEGRG